MWGGLGLWDVHSPRPSRAVSLILQGWSSGQALLPGAQRKAGCCSSARPEPARLEKGWGTSSHSQGVRDGVNQVLSQQTKKGRSVHCPPQRLPQPRSPGCRWGTVACVHPSHCSPLPRATSMCVRKDLSRSGLGAAPRMGLDFAAEAGPWEGLQQSEMVEHGLGVTLAMRGPHGQGGAMATYH